MTWTTCESQLRAKYRARTRTITCAAEEAYLRDDVSCGCEGCPYCPPPLGSALAADAQAYLLPDADVLSELLEVFELPDISNWILTTSILQRLSRRGSTRLQARVRALYKDRRRRCYVFDDLHCIFTRGPGAAGGAAVDRQLYRLAPWLVLSQEQGGCAVQQRGQLRQLHQLLVVASYYEQHLSGGVPIVVLSSLLSPTLTPTQAAAGAVAAATTTAAVGSAPTAGPVAIEAEDDEAELGELLQLLHIGPPRSSWLPRSCALRPALWSSLLPSPCCCCCCSL